MFFFFNDTATTEIYTLSLHDALPILPGFRQHHRLRFESRGPRSQQIARRRSHRTMDQATLSGAPPGRSEEHTSELQSQSNLVCRLLLEKKKAQHEPIVCCGCSAHYRL